MIVVEGPDGAGKTTLIQEIQAQFSVTVAPRLVSTEAKSVVPDMKAATEERVRNLNQGVVFDRHPIISGPIYGTILHEGTNHFMFESLGWLWAMTELFYRAKPTIIYCLPPREVCLEDNRHCWPTQATDQQVRGIYNAYIAKAGVDMVYARAFHYDYTEGPRHLKSVMGYINREEWF